MDKIRNNNNNDRYKYTKKNWQKYNILGMTINARLSANSVNGRLVEFKVRFTANSRRAEENSIP